MEADSAAAAAPSAAPDSVDLFAALVDVGKTLWAYYGNESEEVFLNTAWRTSVLGTIVGLICAQNTTNQWSSVMYGNIVALCPRVSVCPAASLATSCECGVAANAAAASSTGTRNEPPEAEADWDRLRQLCASQLQQGVGLRSLEIALSNGPYYRVKARYIYSILCAAHDLTMAAREAAAASRAVGAAVDEESAAARVAPTTVRSCGCDARDGACGTARSTLRSFCEQETSPTSLDSLLDVDVWDTCTLRKYLLSLKGVGPKTAACVMLYRMRRHDFAVDTNILRISTRLGWHAAMGIDPDEGMGGVSRGPESQRASASASAVPDAATGAHASASAMHPNLPPPPAPMPSSLKTTLKTTLEKKLKKGSFGKFLKKEPLKRFAKRAHAHILSNFEEHGHLLHQQRERRAQSEAESAASAPGAGSEVGGIEDIEDIGSGDSWRSLCGAHIAIMIHGEIVCRAKPRCGICPLQDRCEYFARRTRERTRERALAVARATVAARACAAARVAARAARACSASVQPPPLVIDVTGSADNAQVSGGKTTVQCRFGPGILGLTLESERSGAGHIRVEAISEKASSSATKATLRIGDVLCGVEQRQVFPTTSMAQVVAWIDAASRPMLLTFSREDRPPKAAAKRGARSVVPPKWTNMRASADDVASPLLAKLPAESVIETLVPPNLLRSPAATPVVRAAAKHVHASPPPIAPAMSPARTGNGTAPDTPSPPRRDTTEPIARSAAALRIEASIKASLGVLSSRGAAPRVISPPSSVVESPLLTSEMDMNTEAGNETEEEKNGKEVEKNTNVNAVANASAIAKVKAAPLPQSMSYTRKMLRVKPGRPVMVVQSGGGRGKPSFERLYVDDGSRASTLLLSPSFSERLLPQQQAAAHAAEVQRIARVEVARGCSAASSVAKFAHLPIVTIEGKPYVVGRLFATPWVCWRGRFPMLGTYFMPNEIFAVEGCAAVAIEDVALECDGARGGVASVPFDGALATAATNTAASSLQHVTLANSIQAIYTPELRVKEVQRMFRQGSFVCIRRFRDWARLWSCAFSVRRVASSDATDASTHELAINSSSSSEGEGEDAGVGWEQGPVGGARDGASRALASSSMAPEEDVVAVSADGARLNSPLRVWKEARFARLAHADASSLAASRARSGAMERCGEVERESESTSRAPTARVAARVEASTYVPKVGAKSSNRWYDHTLQVSFCLPLHFTRIVLTI